MAEPESSAAVTPFLVVPDFARLWEQARLAGSAALPGLDKLVRRGRVTRVGITDPLWLPWQGAVLQALGLPATAEHAIAPLEWLGAGGEPRAGTWLRAEFVHVEVGTHAARLHAVHLDEDAAARLRESLREHMVAAGWHLCLAGFATERFHLHTDRELEAACPLPSFAGTDVREQLPQGPAGAELRRLFTEAQMLLHEHPVNTERERMRLQPANAIWFSGCGTLRTVAAVPLPGNPASIAPLRSDEPWARGLARLHASTCESLPANASAWLATTDPGIAIASGHADAPIAALEALEHRWFSPLASALGAGRIAHLGMALATAQGTLHVAIDAATWRRFWRRGRPLAAWLS